MTISSDDEAPTLVDADVLSAETKENKSSISTSEPSRKVPITIVTGYLGAGKTTLLNYILTEQHGKRIAVLLNEFGDTASIERSLTVTQRSGAMTEEWINLANGCICCSIKDQGVNALETLMERSGTFDYILLETTGLADPGNIAPMFWVDEGLGSTIFLDGVVTVVDAKNILTSLDEPAIEELPAGEGEDRPHDHEHDGPLMTTAHLQISHADILILNKTDLVTPAQLSQVSFRLQSINSLARVVHTTHARLPHSSLLGTLLELNAYQTFPSLPPFYSKGHSHLDPTISSVAFTLPPFDPQKMYTLENFLRATLWEQDMATKGYEVHRTKGRIVMTDGSIKVVQGVREIFEIVDAVKSNEEERGDEDSKLVFIGRGLEKITGLGQPEDWSRSSSEAKP